MGLLGGYCETDEERAAIEQRDRDYVEADEAAKRIAELEAALEPFAALGHANVKPQRDDRDGCEVVVSVRQMRRAMAAMPFARSTKWKE